MVRLGGARGSHTPPPKKLKSSATRRAPPAKVSQIRKSPVTAIWSFATVLPAHSTIDAMYSECVWWSVQARLGWSVKRGVTRGSERERHRSLGHSALDIPGARPPPRTPRRPTRVSTARCHVASPPTPYSKTATMARRVSRALESCPGVHASYGSAICLYRHFDLASDPLDGPR